MSELMSNKAIDLDEANRSLAPLNAAQRVRWAVEHLPGGLALSSSFGIQAAVMLHLVTQVKPDVPVILLDTGYLFKETYQFIDELSEQLRLNLHTFVPLQTAAMQEARYGQLWQQGIDGIKQYNAINKVEPMNRALKQLNISTWFSGLRRTQSDSRAHLPILSMQGGRYKFLPIVDWSNQQIYSYLQQHGLSYHPLWEQGYVSVGDTHTSSPLQAGMSEQETRFFGLKRECGLHEGAENEGSGI